MRRKYTVPSVLPNPTPATDINYQAGVFLPNGQITLNQVADGASHTIMIAELLRLQPPAERPEARTRIISPI